MCGHVAKTLKSVSIVDSSLSPTLQVIFACIFCAVPVCLTFDIVTKSSSQSENILFLDFFSEKKCKTTSYSNCNNFHREKIIALKVLILSTPINIKIVAVPCTTKCWVSSVTPISFMGFMNWESVVTLYVSLRFRSPLFRCFLAALFIYSLHSNWQIIPLNAVKACSKLWHYACLKIVFTAMGMSQWIYLASCGCSFHDSPCFFLLILQQSGI